MTRIFKDRKKGLGIGLQAFYYQVALSYLNSQKKYKDEFLRSKGNYEIQNFNLKKLLDQLFQKHLMKDGVWIELI